MANGIIATRAEFNNLIAHLRTEIIAAYNTMQRVSQLLDHGEYNKAIAERLLAEVKAAGRRLVEAIVLIKKMQANVSTLSRIYDALFGRNGPGADTLRMAGINPTVAIEGMNRQMPAMLAGCNREMQRLKDLADELTQLTQVLN